VSRILASWNQLRPVLLRIQALRRIASTSTADAPVGWSAELSPWCVTVTGCRRRGAKGDIVAASCLHDPLDRVHNDLWLVDRYHVTGLSSDHQTSSF